MTLLRGCFQNTSRHQTQSLHLCQYKHCFRCISQEAFTPMYKNQPDNCVPADAFSWKAVQMTDRHFTEWSKPPESLFLFLRYTANCQTIYNIQYHIVTETACLFFLFSCKTECVVCGNNISFLCYIGVFMLILASCWGPSSWTGKHRPLGN